MPSFPVIDFYLMSTEALKWLAIASSAIFSMVVALLGAMAGLRAFSRFLTTR